MPVIISKRYFDGAVESGCATFIILNDEGWIITCYHVIEPNLIKNKHNIELQEYNKKVKEVESDEQSASSKKKKIAKIKYNPKWITNISYWWGANGCVLEEIKYDRLLDIAICRIKPFSGISTYPTFKNPSNGMLVGTSLCRLGYPLHQVITTYDEKNNQFKIEKGVLPMPRFPLDGIHTRIMNLTHEKEGRTVKFIETSSPGLRGQSGGPIFDVNGNVWAIQSNTRHFPLGFSPKINKGNKEIEEHQFINVGLGTHVEEITKFLDANNIKYNKE